MNKNRTKHFLCMKFVINEKTKQALAMFRITTNYIHHDFRRQISVAIKSFSGLES